MDEDLFDPIESVDEGLPSDVFPSGVGFGDLSTDTTEPARLSDAGTSSSDADDDASTSDDLAEQAAAAIDAIVDSSEPASDDQQHDPEEQRKTGSQANQLTDYLVASEDVDDLDFAPTPFLAGPGCYVDGTGVYQRALPGTAKGERYGKTDEALEEGESVTVSLWSYDADEEEWVDSDEDQEDVYDSFWYRGLTIAA